MTGSELFEGGRFFAICFAVVQLFSFGQDQSAVHSMLKKMVYALYLEPAVQAMCAYSDKIVSKRYLALMGPISYPWYD